MRGSINVLVRLCVVMALALSAVAMVGMSASADDHDTPTQSIDEEGNIDQETGEDGPSQSIDEEGNIDQETGEGGPCQSIDEDGTIDQGMDCPTPTEEPTEKPTEEPTEKPTEEPTEKPTEEPTEKPTEEPTEKPTEEVVVEVLPSTGEGSGDQGIGTTVLMLGSAGMLLMLAAGIAWMQRRTA